jgi:hypothetical protein
MSTLEIPWLKLSLSDTLYYATEENNESAFALQWHSSGSTLFIMFSEEPEIDIRLDREIVEIEVSRVSVHCRNEPSIISFIVSEPYQKCHPGESVDTAV